MQVCVLSFDGMFVFVSGLAPGSVVVSDSTVDGLMRPYLEMVGGISYVFN